MISCEWPAGVRTVSTAVIAAPASTWVQLSGSFCTLIDDTAVTPRVSAAPAGRQSRWAAKAKAQKASRPDSRASHGVRTRW